MAAHLQEAAIVEALLADEDRLHRGLHVVVDAAPAGALEQGEGPVVGVEHHLLRLARIGPHEQHAAVTEPDMGDLHDHRHAAQQDDLVAPVELEGFSRRKAQRDVGRGRRLPALLGPSPGVATHGIVAAVIATPAQFLEDPDQRQLLAGSLRRIARQQLVEFCCPSAQLRSRLDLTFVLERRLSRPQHLADRVPGHLQVPGDLLDRLALEEMLAPNPPNRLHCQHSPTTRFESKRAAHQAQWEGVNFGRRSPGSGGQNCTPNNIVALRAHRRMERAGEVAQVQGARV